MFDDVDVDVCGGGSGVSKYERVCYCFDICQSLGSTIKYIDIISSKCMVGDGEVVAPDGR